MSPKSKLPRLLQPKSRKSFCQTDSLKVKTSPCLLSSLENRKKLLILEPVDDEQANLQKCYDSQCKLILARDKFLSKQEQNLKRSIADQEQNLVDIETELSILKSIFGLSIDEDVGKIMNIEANDHICDERLVFVD